MSTRIRHQPWFRDEGKRMSEACAQWDRERAEADAREGWIFDGPYCYAPPIVIDLSELLP